MKLHFSSFYPNRDGIVFRVWVTFLVIVAGLFSTQVLHAASPPPCSGDLVSLSLIYSGPSGVDVQVYRRGDGSQSLASFTNVQTGDLLTVNAGLSPYGQLQGTTWIEVQDPNNPCLSPNGCLQALPSGCNSYAATSSFGNFTVANYKDQTGQVHVLNQVVSNGNRQVSAPPSNPANTNNPIGNATNRTTNLYTGISNGSPRRNNGQNQAKSAAGDLDGEGLSANALTDELDVNVADGLEINNDIVEVKTSDLVVSGSGLEELNNNIQVNPGDGIGINGTTNEVEVNAADLVNNASGLSVTNNDLQVNVDGVTIEIQPNNDLRIGSGAAGDGLDGGSITPLRVGDGPGIGVSADEVSVNVDGSSIVIDGFTDELEVGQGGITHDHIGVDEVRTGNIKDGDVFPRDIASGGNDKVLATDGAGNVVWVDQSAVQAAPADGDGLVIDVPNNETDVNTGDGLTITNDAVTVVTSDIDGNGLTTNNNNLDVNPGDGIAVNADQVEVVASDLDGNGLITNNNNLEVNPGPGIAIFNDQVVVNTQDLDGAGFGVNGTTFQLEVNVDNSTIEIDGSDNLRVKPNGITTNEIQDGTISTADLGQNGASNGQVLVWNGTAWVPATYADNDNDSSNEIQNLGSSASGTNRTITIDGGGTGTTISVADNDNDPSNEYNTGATLVGTDLQITDGGGTQTVDLSSLNNSGTDDQNLTGATLTGANLQISIENGSSATVDLSALEESADIAQVASDLAAHELADGDLDNTNEFQTLSQTGNTVTLSDGGGTISVADNDNDSGNEIQTLGITGNTISLSNGGGSVVLPPSSDNQDLTLSGNTLSLTNDPSPVDLSGYLDNTDNQTLSITGNQLNISGGNSVSLPPDGDSDSNNEIQNITRSGSTVTLSNGGGSVSINDADANPTNELQTLIQSGTQVTLSNGGGTISVADNDNSSSNEIQNLGLSGNTLSISGGNNVSLAGFVNTDNQNLSSTGSGTNRTINITGGTGTTINVADNDNNSSNELQTISKSGSTVTLSNGGGSFTDAVNDADASPTNELQSLSISGSTISLTNGGGSVTVPSTADNLGNHNATTRIQPVGGNNAGTGIQWADNIWGGSGDVAWIKYYQESGENTKLQFFNQNDGDDDIELFQAGGARLNVVNGRVGINNTNPQQSLHVNGTTRISTLAGSGNRMVIANSAGDMTTQSIPVNTDNQNLSNTVSGTNRTINITGGTGTTINVADNDNSSSNELQTLGISGITISLSNGGGSVTVPSTADNLGNHNATQNLDMNDLTLLDANTVQTNVLLDPEDGTLTVTDNLLVTGNTTTNGDFIGRINMQDTRGTNPGPNTFNNEVHFEFKNRSTIGSPGSGTYGGLITLAPWSDNSGNRHHQMFFNDGGIYYRNGLPDNGTWFGWDRVMTQSALPDNSATNEIQTLGISGNTISLSNGGGAVTIPSTSDNLGNHIATTNLNMNSREIDNVNFLDMRPGNGYGVRFWSSNEYKIAMGNASEYLYGPVTDYSIKNFMSNTPGRGWTWGVNGFTPVAAINTGGAMQIEGSMKISNNNATGGGLILADDGGIFDRNDGYASLAFSNGIDIEDAQDNGDHLLINFNDSYPEILGYRNGGGTLVEFKTGMYNNGGTFYSQNQMYARAGIANDAGTLTLNDNVLVTSLAGSGTRMVTADASGNLSTTSIPGGADNLGNHSATTSLDMNANDIYEVNRVVTRGTSDYDKLRVYSSSNYTIGMHSGMTLGYLNDWATTFTMNNETDRGWVWRDVNDATSDGAMSLTTNGRMYVKSHSTFADWLSVGNTSRSYPLYVTSTSNGN